MTSVKADVEQELRADELREILSKQQKELDSLKDTISEAGRDIEKQADLAEAIAEPVEADDKPRESDSVAELKPASASEHSDQQAAGSAGPGSEEPAAKAKP